MQSPIWHARLEAVFHAGRLRRVPSAAVDYLQRSSAGRDRWQQAFGLYEASNRVYTVQDLRQLQMAAKDLANAAPWDVSDNETKDVADGDVQDMKCDGIDAVWASGSNGAAGVRPTRAKRTRDASAATDCGDDGDCGRARKRAKKRGRGPSNTGRARLC